MAYTKIIYDNSYLGYPLLSQETFPVKGYRAIILDKLIERYEDAFLRFGKVLLVRLTIRFPEGLRTIPDNACFQHFVELYVETLRKFGLHYIWCVEQSFSENFHYHLYLFLNGGNDGLHYFLYPVDANRIWSHTLKLFYGIEAFPAGLVHLGNGGFQGTPMNNGMIIPSGHLPLIQEGFRCCSYIAKVYTKENLPPGLREFNCSLMKGGVAC